MTRKVKIIIGSAALLFALLVAVFCVEYFVLRAPLFDRSGWHTTKTGAIQYRDYYAKPMTGWQTLEGSKYYFDENGSRISGWKTVDGQKYYFAADGKLFSGWLEEGGKRYYLTAQGIPHTGWLEEAGRQYYLNDDGILQTGWLTDGGNRYYLTAQGTPHTGWLEEGGKRYYFSEQGAIYTGWLQQDDKRCYLGEDGSLQTGWLELSEGTYLLDAEGCPMTGWVKQENLRYYFDETGLMNTNWKDTAEGLTYWVDGVQHFGWLEVPEGKFYFNETGCAHTGWVTDEKGRFYLYGDGTFASGFVEIGGVERYFMPTGEYIILCNRWNYVPDDYEMNLVSIGKFKVDASCYDAMVEMMDAAKQDGITIKINNTYRSKKTQQGMWEVRREKYMGQGMTLAEADAYIGRSVAIPGTSEHQTGLAADLNGSQKQYDWLAENSWKYGFILRYPENKTKETGIIFEPWHFRYVGTALAKDIYDSGLCLEEYMELLKEQQKTAAQD